MRLAENVSLRTLVHARLPVATDKGANAGAIQVASLVAGMVAGADSIDDMALLRHGGTNEIFTNRYAVYTRIISASIRVRTRTSARRPRLPSGDRIECPDPAASHRSSSLSVCAKARSGPHAEPAGSSGTHWLPPHVFTGPAGRAHWCVLIPHTTVMPQSRQH